MNNIFKKSLSVVSSVAILAASGIIGVNATGDNDSGSTEPLVYFWDFSSEEELNDFYFGYLDNRDSGQSYLPSDSNWKDHWSLVEEDGRTLLKRSNLVEGEGASTESRIAALTFKEKIPYFEAEVTFKLDQRDPYWSPAVFLYGSDGINNYHGHNSSIVQMAREGDVKIGGWGTGGDGPATDYAYSSQREGNGSKLTDDGLGDAYQTMKIRVTPSIDPEQPNYPTGRYDLQVWVKNGDRDYVKLVDAQNMNHYWYRRWGYISLQALNGGVAYDSLKITVLGADGNPVMDVAQTNANVPGAEVTYNYDFTDAAQMDNFSSYYYTDENGGDDWVAGTSTPYADLYTLDTESGKLIRKNLSKSPRSEENSLLYLNKRFQYYEVELQYEFGESYGWTILGFNSQVPGNDYDFESFAVFLTQEGQFNVNTPKFQDPVICNAVSDPPSSDSFQQEQADGNYTFKKEGQHTLKVRVEKGAAENTIHITIWHKQDSGEYEKLYETDYTNRLMYNRGGYISINTQNDTMKIDNLSVKPLDENGSYLYNPLDKSELQDLIDNAETNTDGKYTADSFKAYADAILAGQTALTQATTQQQIEDAIAEIERTFGLLELADKTAWDRVYTFDSNEEMTAFNAYLIPSGTGKGEEAAWSDLWTMEGGKLVRKSTGENPSTQDRNAMLYLKQPLQYFEAEVEMEFGASWGWLQFGFGAQEMGYHAENPASPSSTIFLERECYLHARIPNGSAGDTNVWGGNMVSYWGGTVDDSHENLKPGVHTFRILVEPSDKADTVLVTLKVKSESNNNEEFVALNKVEFRSADLANKEGYFYLQAQNDNSTINSLKIREIEAPVPDTTTTEADTTTTSDAETTTTSDTDTTTTDSDTPTSDSNTTTTDSNTSSSDANTTTASSSEEDTNPPATGSVTIALAAVVLLAGSAAAMVITKKHRS